MDQQKEMKQKKKVLQNDLRNAQRRRKRLKHKARLLTAGDLLEVMQLRQDENVMKAAKTGDAQELAALDEAGNRDGNADEELAAVDEAGKRDGNADE